MTTPHTLSEICRPELARQRLAELVEQACEAAATSHPDSHAAVRVEVPVEPAPALAWLQCQEGFPRSYWSDRDGLFEAAGVGAADVVFAAKDVDYRQLFRRLQTHLSPSHPNLRYYGGARFAPSSAQGPPWQSLGSAYFVLPRFELLIQDERAHLACNMIGRRSCSDLTAVLADLDWLRFPDQPLDAAIPVPLSREDRPTRAGWEHIVGRTLGALRDAVLEKVVLARESFFKFAERLEPVTLLGRLVDNTQRSYHFCFQPGADAAFIGASPERLYKRQGGRVQSEALAGTRSRGASFEADAALGDELLHSDKDLREHRFVVEAIRAAFDRMCRSIHVDEAISILRLRHCQHLFNNIEGSLAEGIGDADLLEALHPTPAVGGHPTSEAVRWIAEVEPFDRGWYAGPVGWVGCDGSEFAVAIRSGLIAGDTVSLYSGAGIVAGSTAEDEWDEIENKMGNFLSALTSHDL